MNDPDDGWNWSGGAFGSRVRYLRRRRVFGGDQSGADNPPNTILARAGSFILTGAVMAPTAQYVMVNDVGVFALTGIDAAFILTGAPRLTADPATFTLTGVAANLVYLHPSDRDFMMSEAFIDQTSTSRQWQVETSYIVER